MDKQKQFQELVEKAHHGYLNYVRNQQNVEPKFLKLLESDDEKERRELWDEIKESVDPKSVANPCFIGSGNPYSNVLIVGKELGFDADDKNQFFNESIQNVFHWQKIVNEHYPEIEHYNNPKIPYKGLQKDFNGGHTWRYYDKFLSNLFDKQYSYGPDNSFLQDCFITEFSYLPRNYSNGNPSFNEAREQILSDPFFKSFDHVLLTYRAYDPMFARYTEKMFEVDFKQRDKIGKQEYLYYEAPQSNRKIVLTNHLSGSAGWSDEEIKGLAALFR